MSTETATLARVKELRDRTGAGIVNCKKALQECEDDIEQAITVLREKGLAAAAKRAGRTADEGLVESYIHGGGKIGVLVEVNCETDFVARTEEFQRLAREVAMQIAAASPRYVRREEVPPAELERERGVYRVQVSESRKPENVIDRIVDGKIEKYYREVCLLEQPFIREPKKSVGELIQEVVVRTGENIMVRRFARFELGEGESRDEQPQG